MVEYELDEATQTLRISRLGLYGNSIEDFPLCMAAVIDKLIEIRRIPRLIISDVRDYEYDFEQVKLLFEIASAITAIREKGIISMENILLRPESDQFIPGRYGLLQRILTDLKYDPVQAYRRFLREVRHTRLAIKKLQSGERVTDHAYAANPRFALASLEHYLSKTLLPMKEILDGCRLLQAGKASRARDRSIYRKIFRPTTRPGFMFTRFAAMPPAGAEPIDHYTVGDSHVEIFKLPDSVRRLYFITPPEFRLREEEYTLLEQARKYLGRHEPRAEELAEPQLFRENIFNISLDLLKDLSANLPFAIEEGRLKKLADILTRYTAGLGILELLLADDKITDILINSPIGAMPAYIQHADHMECQTNIFPSPEDGESWATRFRLQSGRPLDEANPVLDTELAVPGGRARVAAITRPLSPDGLGFAFRRFRDRPWTFPLFVRARMMNSFAAGLLWFIVDGARTMLVGGTRGSGKCVDGRTLVMTGDGRLVPIKDVVEGAFEKFGSVPIYDGMVCIPQNMEIIGLDENLRMARKKVRALFKRKAPSKLISLTTSSGRAILTTFEHPYFIPGEGGSLIEKQAKDLKAGDRIATARILPKAGSFHGFEAGGLKQEGRARPVRAASKALAESFNKARGSTLPACLLNMDSESTRAFIREYFGRSSTISPASIELSTASRDAAAKMQLLLLRFGISSTIRQKAAGGTCWQLVIRGRDAAAFGEQIGFVDPEKKAKPESPAGRHTVPCMETDGKMWRNEGGHSFGSEAASFGGFEGVADDSGPGAGTAGGSCSMYTTSASAMQMAALQGSAWQNPEQEKSIDRLAMAASSDIFWDSVMSVEEAEPEDGYVYDIEVEGHPSFVANGIIAHNTSLLGSILTQIMPKIRIITTEDSVSGDCRLLVRKDGKIRKERIGDLVDRAIEKNGYRPGEAGHEISDNADAIEVLSLVKGRIEWLPVKSFIRHKVKKDLITVRTRTGREIKVTPDHSLFGLSAGCEIVPVRAGELSKGSCVAVPGKLPGCGGFFPDKINILEHQDKLRGMYVSGESPDARVKARSDSHSIPALIGLDEDFLTFLGLWLGDGRYDAEGVIVSARDEEARKAVMRAAGKLGLGISFHGDGRSLALKSKALKQLMQNILEFHGDARRRAFPGWVHSLGDSQLACILRGLYSSGRAAGAGISLASKELLWDVQTALLRLGIVSRRSERGGSLHLSISSPGAIRRFSEAVGFLQEKRKRWLDSYCSKAPEHDLADAIPLPEGAMEGLEEVLGPGRHGYAREGYLLDRKKLLEPLSALNADGGGATFGRLKILAEGDVVWDYVTDVKRESFEGYVYDLSVPATENFVCENFIAHNTLEIPVPQLRELGYNIERLKSRSVITHVETELPAEEALRTALRLGDSALILGEVRSAEALALYEAMRIGALANVVAGTIHGESAAGLFDRVVHDLGVPPTSFKATDIIVIANVLRSPDLLRSYRRITEITEVRKHWTQDPVAEGGFVPLMEYSAKEDQLVPTRTLLMGESVVLNEIANRVKEWKANWEAVWDNINLRARVINALAEAATVKPEIIEAAGVVQSNSMFALFSDQVRQEVGTLDSRMIFDRWYAWLKSKL